MTINGVWNLSMMTPMGLKKPVLKLAEANNVITGTLTMPNNAPCNLTGGKLVGATGTMQGKMTQPTLINLEFCVTFNGNSLTGTCASDKFQPFPLIGARDEVDLRPRLTRWKEFLFG